MKKKGILICLLLLMLISIINLYSINSTLFIKELIWYIISLGLLFLINKWNINYIFKYSFYLYLIGNILLLLASLKSGFFKNGKINLSNKNLPTKLFNSNFTIFILNAFFPLYF